MSSKAASKPASKPVSATASPAAARPASTGTGTVKAAIAKVESKPVATPAKAPAPQPQPAMSPAAQAKAVAKPAVTQAKAAVAAPVAKPVSVPTAKPDAKPAAPATPAKAAPVAKPAQQPAQQPPRQPVQAQAPTSPKKPAGNALQDAVTSSRAQLQKFWSEHTGGPVSATPTKSSGKPASRPGSPTKSAKSVKVICGEKWDHWSESVRMDFLKRAQQSTLASIQTRIPRKQWAQWEVTLKFCLDDLFVSARGAAGKSFAAEKDGLLSVLEIVIQGKENEKNRTEFEKKIQEMLAEMKPGIVPGFDVKDGTHTETLRSIRSVYAIEWTHYIIAKLLAA